MNPVTEKLLASPEKGIAIAEKLKRTIRGDVRFDDLSRTLYATDASIYEMTPLGVVLPRDTNDVIATVKICQEANVPIIARGAGTGLTGGAVGSGVQLDLSRYMNRIGNLELEKRTIEVEPGVVLDELNAHLAPHGLHFAPDVATSSRATIGGMIANNSCGAHSVLYGRTVDHVLSLTCVLSTGDLVTFHRTEPQTLGSNREFESPNESRAPCAPSLPKSRAGDATFYEHALSLIRDQYHGEIQKRFPRVLRSNGGYGLDRLGPPKVSVDVTKLLCGSEGTLAIIVSATLNLVPLPQHAGLVVVHFSNLLSALSATPAILKHQPAAIELIDKLILSASRSHPSIAEPCAFLEGEPEAILVVEFFDDDFETLEQHLGALTADPEI
ncbi:MAG: FAD-binding oxidoreductase, partial [Planctomycetota bacterium]